MKQMCERIYMQRYTNTRTCEGKELRTLRKYIMLRFVLFRIFSSIQDEKDWISFQV